MSQLCMIPLSLIPFRTAISPVTELKSIVLVSGVTGVLVLVAVMSSILFSVKPDSLTFVRGDFKPKVAAFADIAAAVLFF